MKVIVYQIFTRLFGNGNATRRKNGTIEQNGAAKMNGITDAVLQRVRRLGATHVWLTGIIRHASTTDYTAHGIPSQHPAIVKGLAGSPYAITDYYDIDPDIATDVDHRMAEFEALVGRAHAAGLKVIIDFVPNHVARQYHSVAKPDGVVDLGELDNTDMHFSTLNDFYYCWGQPFVQPVESDEPYIEQPAKATGNDCFHCRPGRNDWYETVKINYGIDYCDAGGRSEHFSPLPVAWDKMTDILLFWAAKGIDGFRCDMAEMVPTAFWAWAIDKVKFRYPDKVFIAEVYNPSQYRNYIGAGFDYLYDKVGMYDCVRDVICGRRQARDITGCWQATDDIWSHMLYFLENHDEQRIASDFFAGDARRGVPGLVVLALMRQNPFMLYFGQELGERGMDEEGLSGRDGRTTIFDYWSVTSVQHAYFDRRRMTRQERDLEKVYATVLNIATTCKAVTEGDFYDLMYVNPQLPSTAYAFLRKKDDELLLVVANFASEAADCPVIIPRHAFEWLHIGEGAHEACDLLGTDKTVLTLRADTEMNLTVPPLLARAYIIKV